MIERKLAEKLDALILQGTELVQAPVVLVTGDVLKRAQCMAWFVSVMRRGRP